MPQIVFVQRAIFFVAQHNSRKPQKTNCRAVEDILFFFLRRSVHQRPCFFDKRLHFFVRKSFVQNVGVEIYLNAVNILRFKQLLLVYFHTTRFVAQIKLPILLLRAGTHFESNLFRIIKVAL